MLNSTPFFPGLNIRSLRRPALALQQKIADEREWLATRTFRQIGELCGKFIPGKLLAPNPEGNLSRNRIYSKTNVFWAFFSQILSPDGGCGEVVKKIQSYCSERGLEIPSSSTASYCAARGKLAEEELAEILERVAEHLDAAGERSFHDRRIVVVDGTGFSMPDTEENQAEWPQSATQKPGCGFPSGRICACFNLDTGGLLSHRVGNKKSHELPLLRDQHATFRKDDIFLGDKAFCSYYDIAKFMELGVDSVVPLARRKPVAKGKCVRRIDDNDLVIRWKRPYFQKAKSSFSREEWERLPKELLLRQIKVVVAVPGFRVEEFYIITTLLDDAVYSAEEIADLYYRRWDVELFFRDLKTTMGMDILRCMTPSMIRKELQMYFIVYNCIRCLMGEAATVADVPVRHVSFKGALQAMRNWEPLLNPSRQNQRELKRMQAEFYETVGRTLIDERPGRSEPRCVKRRPKPFQHMTAPRGVMKETPHRGKRTAKGRLN
jgi:hypothetical protein